MTLSPVSNAQIPSPTRLKIIVHKTRSSVVKRSALKSKPTKPSRVLAEIQLASSRNQPDADVVAKVAPRHVHFAPMARVVLVRKLSKEEGRQVWYNGEEYRTFDHERRKTVAVIQHAIDRKQPFDSRTYTVLGLEKYLRKPKKVVAAPESATASSSSSVNQPKSAQDTAVNKRKEMIHQHAQTVLAKQYHQETPEKQQEQQQQQPSSPYDYYGQPYGYYYNYQYSQEDSRSDYQPKGVYPHYAPHYSSGMSQYGTPLYAESFTYNSPPGYNYYFMTPAA